MLKPFAKDFKGLITITGATKSGKSQLAEFLIKDQESITYIATSKPRDNDPGWNERIKVHRERRPETWNFIEYPFDVCKVINSIGNNESILLDSLGGVVEQFLMESEDKWQLFQSRLITSLIKKNLGIIVVAEEVGCGIVPATRIGHIFRERHCNLLYKINFL